MVELPKNYKETVKAIAELYSLKCIHISRAMICNGKGIVISASDKIFVINGLYSLTEYTQEQKRLTKIGKALDKLGVD